MTSATGPVRLEARNVSFAYARPVILNLTLSLPAGIMTGLIGPNGSGKTTALRLLDGILRPSSGEVLLDGKTALATLTRKEIARRISLVPQNAGIHPNQSVFQFAMQGRSPHLHFLGFESERDEEVTLEALELTHMTRYRDARVSEISGGERQRLLLARALTQRSQVLLLDEFTANLDINYQVELMRLVKRITQERKLATLVVSHEINLLATFCSHIVLMADGVIFQQGKVAEVLTPDNLKKLFRLEFSVRQLNGEGLEVVPILDEGNHHEKIR